MNVEDPKVIQDAIDHAGQVFGGILHSELDAALTRLEATVARAEALVARVDGAMVMFKLAPPEVINDAANGPVR